MGTSVDSCLICDDHAMMRAALSGTIALMFPAATRHLAQDFATAIGAARAQRPDLILCDLAMPGAAPFDGIAAIMATAPDTPLLVITGSEDDALLLALLRHGVSGFLHKSSSAEVVEAAIALVVAGGRYLPPRLLALTAAPIAMPAPTGPSARLTDRQQQILAMIAAGLSNKQIARDLSLSPATVKTHVAALIAALDAGNRTEAVYRARATGIIAT
jgi:two-component system, NarL family, nitrate/nitrite response regulator NarL